MKELLFADWKRFRTWAALFAGLHLAVLGFFVRLVDPLQQPLLVHQAAGATYGALGLLLAVAQFSTYRRGGAWLFLLHRPLSRRRIAAAVLGAGALLLTLVVALPLALTIAGQALATARAVDLRHGLLPLAALALAASTYLAGAFALLSAVRWGFLALAVPALVATNSAHGAGALLVQILAVVVLAALVVSAFKPDRETPPRAPLVRVGTGLVLAMACYLLVAEVGGLAFQISWIFAGSHPLNSTPPRGGFVEASRAAGADLLAAGLGAAAVVDESDPELAADRVQVTLAEVFTVAPRFDRLPARGELTNIAPAEFDDASRNLRWTFSHDTLRFHGVALADGSASGSLGVGTAPGESFPEVPLVLDERTLLGAHTVWGFDSASGRILPRLSLPPGETIAAPPEVMGENLALLSDHRLSFFSPRRAADDLTLLEPRLHLTLPQPIADLSRADVVERLDGYLVSLVFGNGSTDGPGVAWQEIHRLDGDGRVRLIARRDLTADFPSWLRYRRRWLSPALEELRAQAIGLFAAPRPLAARARSATPLPVWALAAALSGVAALASVGLLRGRRVGPGERTSWIVASLLCGLPATASLWLLRLDPLPAASSDPIGTPEPCNGATPGGDGPPTTGRRFGSRPAAV